MYRRQWPRWVRVVEAMPGPVSDACPEGGRDNCTIWGGQGSVLATYRVLNRAVPGVGNSREKGKAMPKFCITTYCSYQSEVCVGRAPVQFQGAFKPMTVHATNSPIGVQLLQGTSILSGRKRQPVGKSHRIQGTGPKGARPQFGLHSTKDSVSISVLNRLCAWLQSYEAMGKADCVLFFFCQRYQRSRVRSASITFPCSTPSRMLEGIYYLDGQRVGAILLFSVTSNINPMDPSVCELTPTKKN